MEQNKWCTVRIKTTTLMAIKKLAKREGRSVPMQMQRMFETAFTLQADHDIALEKK